MDALELLKSDHERVSSLYDRLKSEPSPRGRASLFETLRNELLIHTRAEETVFYPAFKNYPDFSSLLADSYESHRDLKRILKEIDPAHDATLLERVDAVMEIVQAHVREEEGEFFPKVRQLMKRGEREALGRHLLAAKSESTQAA